MKITDLIKHLQKHQKKGIFEIFLLDLNGDIVTEFELVNSSEYYSDTIPQKRSDYLVIEKQDNRVDKVFVHQKPMDRILNNIF